MSAKRIAVAGATGRVARHVVEVLEAAGHEVVSISRSSGVDVIMGASVAIGPLLAAALLALVLPRTAAGEEEVAEL